MNHLGIRGERAALKGCVLDLFLKRGDDTWRYKRICCAVANK
jgi:hypothetical protein